MHDAGKPCNPKIILLIMPLAIMLILSLSMNKACQEILRAIALSIHANFCFLTPDEVLQFPL